MIVIAFVACVLFLMTWAFISLAVRFNGKLPPLWMRVSLALAFMTPYLLGVLTGLVAHR